MNWPFVFKKKSENFGELDWLVDEKKIRKTV